MTVVRFYEPELVALLRGRTGAVARELTLDAIRVESAAKLIATGAPRVQTGRYRTSIGYQIGEDAAGLFADIGSSVPYARFIEEGTPAHLIQPRTKRALFWRGAAHPVRLVRHPGTRAYKVLQRALQVLR